MPVAPSRFFSESLRTNGGTPARPTLISLGSLSALAGRKILLPGYNCFMTTCVYSRVAISDCIGWGLRESVSGVDLATSQLGRPGPVAAGQTS